MSVDAFFSHIPSRDDHLGFDESTLIKKVRHSDDLISLIQFVNEMGYIYAGDTGNDSKAYTDVSKKKICIGKEKTVDEALLSLTYELMNATNTRAIRKTQKKYFQDNAPSQEKAFTYALSILIHEAEAVYFRSMIALQFNLTHLIKNPVYVSIVHMIESSEKAIDLIFQEMVMNGKVHNGKKSAVKHYIDQYNLYHIKKKNSH